MGKTYKDRDKYNRKYSEDEDFIPVKRNKQNKRSKGQIKRKQKEQFIDSKDFIFGL